jgi:hypothetical protein
LLEDGTETVNEGSLNTVVKLSHIDSVRLVLAGETRIEHPLSSEPDKKPKCSMITVVRIRNLSL